MKVSFYEDDGFNIGLASGAVDADFTLELDPKLYERFKRAEQEYEMVVAAIRELRKEQDPRPARSGPART